MEHLLASLKIDRYCAALVMLLLLAAACNEWAAATGAHGTTGWRPPLVVPRTPPQSGPRAQYGNRLVVLMYHHVQPLPPGAGREERNLTVSPQRFEADLRALKAAGCHVLTMRQGQLLLLRHQLPPRAVVLTFDDGYEDNYSIVWPLLHKFGYVGTFNLVYDSLSAAGHMNRQQAKEMAAAGNEIGSHTVSHTPLPHLDSAHLRLELTESKQKLQALVGGPVTTFCYPEGRYNTHDVRAVKAAGYQVAMTVESGRWTTGTPPLEVPRMRITDRTVLERCLNAWLGSGAIAPRRRSY